MRLFKFVSTLSSFFSFLLMSRHQDDIASEQKTKYTNRHKKRLYFLWKCKGANWLIGCAEWTSFWCLRRVWVDATGPPLVEHLELIFQGVMYLQWPDLPSFAWDKKHAFLTWLAGVRSPAGMDQVEWKDQRSNALNKLHENQFVIS